MSMYGVNSSWVGLVTAYGPHLSPGIDAGPTDDFPGAIQSFKEESDINNIMRDIQSTGITHWLSVAPGTYEDVTGCDFASAMDTMVRAQEAFDALPSSLRDRFANNPKLFLDFVHNPANAQEMIDLGLRTPAPPPVEPPTGPGGGPIHHPPHQHAPAAS